MNKVRLLALALALVILIAACAPSGTAEEGSVDGISTRSSDPKPTRTPVGDDGAFHSLASQTEVVLPTGAAKADRATPTAKSEAGTKTFKLGATYDQVRSAQGQPTSIHIIPGGGSTWSYGSSSVTFGTTGKVIDWDNSGGNLRTSQ